MVGRTLDCEIQRDLESVLVGGTDETLEVRERAKLWMDGVVAAFGRADRVRAAWIAGLGAQ
jgi:hypothetical protein